jgi:hypothetical protein
MRRSETPDILRVDEMARRQDGKTTSRQVGEFADC